MADPLGAPEPAEVIAASATAPSTAPTGPAEPSEAPRESQKKRGGLLSFARELPVLVIVAFLLAVLLKTFVVQAFFIPSGSMEPTLMPGDRVLVNKVVYHLRDIHRGDIIVFQDPHPSKQPNRGIVGGFFHWLSEGFGFSQPPDEDFIKRVIGLPGETVELHNAKLYVNGRLIQEPYLHGKPDTRDYGPVTVPKDSLFVLGDNRWNSSDSRFGLGFIPLDKVVGKAFVKIWPPSRLGWLH